MHRFEEISEVLAGLQKLMEREPPLTVMLPRQPGTKESRYAHLLSGDVEEWDAKPVPEPPLTPASADGEHLHLEKEVAALRSDVRDLQKEIADLRQQFAEFKRQFE